MGFEATGFHKGILNVRVRMESANCIKNRYWLHIAIVAEAVLKRAVRAVNIAPTDLSDSQGTIAGR
jgi:hypothetical protein